MLGIAILAAGKGKRMNSTDTPKVLVQLLGKPLLGYVLDTALNISPHKIYVIVGFQKNKVIDFVQNNFSQGNIEFVEQREQLGTGHAILQIEPYFDKSINDLLILSGDVPLISYETLQSFINFHFENGNDLSLISTVVENPKGYGRIHRNSNGQLLRIVEQKDLTTDLENINEINSGIYIVKTVSLFDYLKKLKNQNAQNEYYLTDIVEMYLKDGRKVGAFRIANSLEVLGVNTYEELMNLEKLLIKEKV
ncbi:UDP-N-acetylglucosamine diphosphorylase [Bacteroidetes/Chlorobi group bacterium Naka2016]|nr:MAG: UDP-N-acetylglucosamine diphosphorylase [Bacteroidetes/Chlorobi group bacterium Naka2016]